MSAGVVANSRTYRVLPNGRVATAVTNDSGFPLEVELVTSGTITNQYSAASSVATSVLTDVLTYTVPVGKEFMVKHIEYGGENPASYTVDLNSSTIAFKRTYFAKYDGTFEFFDFKLSAGDVIKVQVEHGRPMSADFEARLVGSLKDA